jgi:hypothetical protein
MQCRLVNSSEYFKLWRRPFSWINVKGKVKKSYPCNRPWRPMGLWDVQAPTFSLDNQLTDGGKVVSITRLPLFFPPGIFLVLFIVRGWVDPGTIVRLEGLGKLKKIYLIGTRTRDLPACSIVPQPIPLPRAPPFYWIRIKTHQILVLSF